MTPAEELLAARIRAAGRITFADYMETALYHPEVGYYTRPGRISAGGDFFTSPEVHPAFGALICVQMREMWALAGRPPEFRCVEFGAAAGTLAADVSGYASRIDPEFAAALGYVMVDRASPRRQEARRGRAVAGCVLSNELLDALPVHRFVVRERRVFEMYVCLSEGRFMERPDEPSDQEIAHRLSGIVERLPDGFRGEIRLGMGDWAREAASEFDRGFAMTIDFGYDRDALYSPERASGTLRCYYHHTVSNDPFKRPGEQDIAAHVDFTQLDADLAGAGLVSLGHASQADFLRRLGAGDFLSGLRLAVASPRDLARNRAGILELLRPDGLGGFRVAIHAKGIGTPRLTGLAGPATTGASGPGRGASGDVQPLPVPVLGPEDARVPVLDGRYPHAAGELTGTWEELLT